MISTKSLAGTALLATVVATVGLAYAQTTVPTPDSTRVEPNKGTMQPGTDGTSTTTPGSAGSTTAPGATGMSTGTPSTTSGTVRAPATPMSADAPMRDQNGNLRSDSMDNNTNNNMNRNMNNSGAETSSGMAPARTERVARTDRN